MKNLLTILGTSVIGISSGLGAAMHTQANLNKISVKTTNQEKSDEQLQVDINFYKEDSFNGTSSEASYNETHIILNFLDYADSWQAFMDKYLTAVISGFVYVHAWSKDEKLTKIQTFTNDISSDVSTTEAIWVVSSSGDGGFAHQELTFALGLWHDDHNIYWGYSVAEESYNSATGCYYEASFANITFR
ncbi:hypothetical protein [Spiroplasma sp. DGKH1]|uniref:hypothetical protein n=1 Tax=Spiroplasma sp. DGKH1 TaxID=3050074 RepID=UPI0034C5FD8C